MMLIDDLTPDHAKRAEIFRLQALQLLGKTEGLGEREAYDATALNLAALSGVLPLLPMSERQRRDNLELGDALDRESAYSSEIGVYATAILKPRLVNLLAQIDRLVGMRGGRPQDRMGRILELDEPGQFPWQLSAAYLFIDDES